MGIFFRGLGLVCICTSAWAQQANPDLILFNGKIFTSVAAHPYVQALAIRGARIVATGDAKTIRALAGPKTRQMDLGGRTAIPGINDAHHHFDVEPLNAVDVNLKTMDPTWAQVKDGIATAILQHTHNIPLNVTIGDKVFEDVSITRDSLDQIAPHNPVALGTFTGHAFILNTAGLRLYGVAEHQPDPLGGRFERDAQGKLTGTVREYAVFNLERFAANAVPESAAVGQLRQSLDEAAKYGVTSVQELSYAMSPERAVPLLEAVPTQVRIHIIRMPGTTPGGRDTEEGRGVPLHPTNLITVSGSKWVMDGVPIEGTLTPRGSLKVPAAPPMDSMVADLPLTFSKQEIAAILQETLKRDDQLLLHVSGYPAAKAVLDAMDASGGKSVWSGRRVRFEHGDGIFADLQERIKEYGIVVVQNPSHLMAGSALGVQAGTELFHQSQPLKSLLAAGISVALGSDGPVNPYLNIMFATIDANRPSEALTREQAVIAYTLTSAYAEFQEGEKGTLEPGRLADIAVLSQDIFAVPTEELPKTKSILTLVGGKVVYRANDSNIR
jgi:predicted amidohydrolase YtcJ